MCRIRGDRVAGSLPHPPLSNGATAARAEIPLVSAAFAYMPATAAARPSGQPTAIRRPRMRPRAASCLRNSHHYRLLNFSFSCLYFLISFCCVYGEVAPINNLRFISGSLRLKTCYKTVFSNIYSGLYFIVKRLYINKLIAIFEYHNLKITTMSEHLTVIKYVGFLFGLENFYSVGWTGRWLSFQGNFNKELIQAILEFKPEVSRTCSCLTLSLPEADFTFTV